MGGWSVEVKSHRMLTVGTSDIYHLPSTTGDSWITCAANFRSTYIFCHSHIV